LLPLPGRPPLDLTAVRVAGETCTLRDERARWELGYEGRVRREEGLAELRADAAADAAAAAPDAAPDAAAPGPSAAGGPEQDR
jgi:hypothetical protein